MQINISDKPLLNKNIVVTRAKAQSGEIISKFEKLGANTILFPTIEIIPLENNQLDQAIINIDNYDWIVFTSTNSVNIFLERYLKNNSIEFIKRKKIAAVGPKIVKELKKYEISTDFVPTKYTSDDLADLFLEKEIKDKKILIPGSKISRDSIISKLRYNKNIVDFIAIYDTKKPLYKDIELIIDKFSFNTPDYITFMSPSSVNNFIEIILDNKLEHKIKNSIFVSIGPTTFNSIKEIFSRYPDYFTNKVLMAEEHTIEGIIQTIISN